MWNALRIHPLDVSQDHLAWHKLLKQQLLILLGMTVLFAGVYYLLEANVTSGDHFSDYQLKLSRLYLGVILIQVGNIVFKHWSTFKGVLAAFLYEPVSANKLGLFRAFFLLLLTGHLLVSVYGKTGQLASLPHAARGHLPGIGWLIDLLPINQPLYDGMLFLAAGLCFLAGIGLWTRWTLPVASILLLYVLGVPQFFGKLYHNHFMVWVPIFLSFSPCADAFSVDSWLQRKRIAQPIAPQYRYGVPLKLIFLQLGLIYFFSAVGKLWFAGLGWALSDNLIYLMRLEWLEQYASIPALRIDRYPLLCRLLGMGVIFFELSYLFLILTPKTRVGAAISAIGFHLSTAYFLSIDFRLLQFLNGFHLDWDQLPKWMQKAAPPAVAFLLLAGLLTILAFWNILLALILVVYLLWWRFFLRNKEASRPLGLPYPRWGWRVGLGLLAINFLFVATQTNSWPFSAYPSYSFVREGWISYIGFHPTDTSGKAIDLDELGKKAAFQKESVLPLAEQAARSYAQGQLQPFQEQALHLWLRYQKLLPDLGQATHADVVLQVYSTNPDQFHAPPSEKILGQLILQNGEWEWEEKRNFLP